MLRWITAIYSGLTVITFFDFWPKVRPKMLESPASSLQRFFCIEFSLIFFFFCCRLSASDVVQQSKDHINKQSVLDPTSEIKSLFAPDGCLSEFRYGILLTATDILF